MSMGNPNTESTRTLPHYNQWEIKKIYKWRKSHPLHGIEQGSMAAPIIWLLISSTLFLSMRKWMKGITTQAPDGQHKTTRYADAFVDDTTLWANQEPSTTALLQRMENELQKYQEMLEWTGGALTLTKCLFSILEWEFHPNGIPKLRDQKYTLQINRTQYKKNQIEKSSGYKHQWTQHKKHAPNGTSGGEKESQNQQ